MDAVTFIHNHTWANLSFGVNSKTAGFAYRIPGVENPIR